MTQAGRKQWLDFAQVLGEELTLIGIRRQRIRELAPAPPPQEADPCRDPLVEDEGFRPPDAAAVQTAGLNVGSVRSGDGPERRAEARETGPDAIGREENTSDDPGSVPEEPERPNTAIAQDAGCRPDADPSGAESKTMSIEAAEESRAGQRSLPETEKEARLEAMDRHLAGLAISGGGIRSATFALGVLQGLADLKILSRFDYLSTVSGGGYIGGWLAAWMKREGRPLDVEKQLSPSRIREAEIDRDVIGRSRIVDEEPEPVHHLRAFSNYLTPRPGLLSVDTWTLLTIYVRNSLINLLLLLPLTTILVLVGRVVVLFYGLPGQDERLRSGVFWVFTGLGLLAILSLGIHISTILYVRAESHKGEKPSSRQGTTTLNVTILWPLVAAAGLACWTFTIVPRTEAVKEGGRELDQNSFTIRVPSSLPLLQPNSEEVLFGFLNYFFPSEESAFATWYGKHGFLWRTAITYGLAFGIGAFLIHLIGYVLFLVFGFDPEKRPREEGVERSRVVDFFWMSLAAFIAGFTGGFLLLAMLSEVLWRLHDQPYAMVTLGPPLVLVVFAAATFVEVWLLGRWQGDDIREWWARVCAWLLIYAAAWLAFFGLTLYGPMLANYFLHNIPLRSGAALGWLTTVVGGAFAGRNIQTKGAGSGWLTKILVRIAPPLFAVGLLVGVAMLVDALVFDSLINRLADVSLTNWLANFDSSAPWVMLLDALVSDSLTNRLGHFDLSTPWVYWNGVVTTPIDRIGRVFAVCAVLTLLATWMSNVNLFSLNSMYASRLTRCYLGASRRKRQWERRGAAWQRGPDGAPTGTHGPARWENAITGFDPDDDMPLWSMRIGPNPYAVGSSSGKEPEYLGPHLIINTALNLVAGGELAWQDRKAESFILTPAHCGSKGTGYAPTTPQTGRELTLGRAVAISGAAVDSNIGLHQSSALIALMTAFNARLGWWMKNPNPSTWSRWQRSKEASAWDAASPSLALPLLLELLGQTDENKKYVHISDGGHFENLAVYELVRRRCRYIVCCDAGTDPQASDDNLAAMIRLCRIDFGVRIEIDTAPFAREGPAQLSRWHCAVGKIRYDDVDGGELPGIFVYLRTSLTGNEPPDVQEYAAKNADFPWQSTLDQFFNESQFESYRALGFHVAQTTFKDAVDDVNEFERLWTNYDAEIEFKRGNQRLFSAVQRRWAPAPSNQNSTFLQAVESWTEIQQTLRTDRELAPLSFDIYPEQAVLCPSGEESSLLHMLAQMIQVMENAWVDLQLGGFRDLPMNRGWMSVFRRWASTDAFRRYWPVLRVEYSLDFVKFCETQLGLRVVDRAIRASDLGPDFKAGAMKILGEEFTREWPKQKSLADLVAEAKESWSGRFNGEPIHFLVQAPPGKGEIADSPDMVACGIIFARARSAGPTSPGVPERFEVFVWLRRTYRGMGIVSRCAKGILIEFRNLVWAQGGQRPITLEARYPAEGVKRMDEMEFLLWRNFFSHYDFRCPRGHEPVTDGYWIIERTFEPEDLEI